MSTITSCPGCGLALPVVDGPVHRYMIASPACWALYGEVLAREYSDPAVSEVHRLSVDAYAVQHPGSTDRQSIQSVAVHLIRLCLFLEYGLTAEDANAAMLDAGKRKHLFTWLQPPAAPGEITVADVAQATTAEAHKLMVRSWAECVWAAWSVHHDTVRAWLPAAFSGQRHQAAPPR